MQVHDEGSYSAVPDTSEYQDSAGYQQEDPDVLDSGPSQEAIEKYRNSIVNDTGDYESV